MKKIKTTSIKIHPRAIEAMGSDLVTNDNVAIVELVKNAYDAFGKRVDIEFGSNNDFISIKDNGLGMSQETIENSWATVATSFKLDNPVIEVNNIKRVVSGNKGLGRLSAARLGNILEIFTKNQNDRTIYAKIDWNSLYSSSNLSECNFDIFECDEDFGLGESGTIIKISELKAFWDESRVDSAKDEISRILNPFSKNDLEFQIFLNNQNKEITLFNYLDSENQEQIKINSFINDPQYNFFGNVDKNGNVIYTFEAKQDVYEKNNSEKIIIRGNVSFEDIVENANKSEGFKVNANVVCGEFSFEIRVWELSTQFIDEISSKHQIKGKLIRNLIQQHKGISVYRDGILVLPKSDTSKDWLGLDKRRISQIGRRLSTSQIIGVIDITSENNPQIGDTSNREAFKGTLEFENFYAICNLGIIAELQRLRLIYKPTEREDSGRFDDIFKTISPTELKEAIDLAIQEQKTPKQLQEVVVKYSDKLERNMKLLQERVEYYAQLASAGTFSKLIIHELRNNVNPMLRFLRYAKEDYSPFSDKTETSFRQATDSCDRLIKLSDVFSPLSRRDFKKQKYESNLSSEINYTILLFQDTLKDSKINIKCQLDKQIIIPVHSGEIQTVLVNLLDNAIYWVAKKHKSGGEIEINSRTEANSVYLNVSDNGEGVDQTLEEKIFEPGITCKLNGFGMGLVVATEIIASHNGTLKNVQPGDLGGATFEISIPILRR